MKLSATLRRKAFPLILMYSIASILCCLTVPMATGQTDPVTFSVAYVPGGVPVGEKVTVDIYIDAPEGSAIVGWVIDVAVDPNVLEPGFRPPMPPITIWAVSGEGGYFLYDWATDRGNTTDFSPGAMNKTAGTILGPIEGVVGWAGLDRGEGASGAGKLVTLFFKSKNATAYSPINITRAHYFTSWNNPSEDKRTPEIINGRYPSIYDVAVTSVSAPSQATAGDIVPINLTAANHLDDYAGFNLALTHGTTVIETRPILLANGTSKTAYFSWNTTGLAPGEYLINATAIFPDDVNPNNNWNTTPIKLNPVIFLVTVDGLEFNVVIGSNSTISVFEFRQGDIDIRFNVTGLEDTVGFCNVTIPMDLMKAIDEPWLIRIDGVETTYTESDNGTHTFLYFTYTHTDKTRNILIRGTWVVPEFPTLTPLLLALAILAVSTIILKRRTQKHPLTRRLRL